MSINAIAMDMISVKTNNSKMVTTTIVIHLLILYGLYLNILLLEVYTFAALYIGSSCVYIYIFIYIYIYIYMFESD
jgi:hypothetical protein